jgi:hypothetical protein
VNLLNLCLQSCSKTSSAAFLTKEFRAFHSLSSEEFSRQVNEMNLFYLRLLELMFKCQTQPDDFRVLIDSAVRLALNYWPENSCFASCIEQLKIAYQD